MEYVFSHQNFAEVLGQWRQHLDPQLQDEPEVQVNWSIPMIQGSKQITWLRPGLSLELDRVAGQTDFQIGGQYTEADVRWYLAFLTTGCFTAVFHRGTQTTSIQAEPQHNFFGFAGVGTLSVWHGFAEQAIQTVAIAISPELMQQFIENSDIELPEEFQPFVEGNFEHSYYQLAPNMPELEMALHQLLHCPYQGKLRQLYLESKAVELIVLKLAQVQTISATSVLRGEDRDRIHAARTILLDQMEHPPSLLALARQVGLNDYKLKQGFREVFGTTVFGYLRSYRMEQARQFLIQGHLSVSEVSRMVGYSSPTQFSLAFKRQFGILPSTCIQKRSV